MLWLLSPAIATATASLAIPAAAFTRSTAIAASAIVPHCRIHRYPRD